MQGKIGPAFLRIPPSYSHKVSAARIWRRCYCGQVSDKSEIVLVVMLESSLCAIAVPIQLYNVDAIEVAGVPFLRHVCQIVSWEATKPVRRKPCDWPPSASAVAASVIGRVMLVPDYPSFGCGTNALAHVSTTSFRRIHMDSLFNACPLPAAAARSSAVNYSTTRVGLRSTGRESARKLVHHLSENQCHVFSRLSAPALPRRRGIS
jgi:hypothetical protein